MDLQGYLRAVGLSASPAERAGLVLRHVRGPPMQASRPAADLIAITAPLRPTTIETRIKGNIVRRVLRRGDICLHPPMIEMEIRLGRTDMIAAFVAAAVLRTMAEAMERGASSKLAFRIIHKTRDTLLSALALELRNEIDLGAPAGERYRRMLSDVFVARIVRRYGLGSAETAAWGTAGQDARIRRALAFIDDRLTRDFGVAEVARHVGVSPAYLTEIFKAATGETIWALVRRRRLEYARDLLARTKLSVATVAEKAGYKSTPRFTQAFKAAFALPPGAYRTSVRP